MGDINDIIQRLSAQHNAQLVDLDSAFHDRHEKIIKRYYDTDAIHLATSGVKRLLGALNKQVLLVKDFDKSSSPKYTARDQTTTEQDLVKIGIDLVEIVIN